MVTSRKDPLLSAKVRAIAEQIGAGKHEAPPRKAPTMFKIPLEAIEDEGLNLSLSMTGSHLCIKI